MYFEEDGSIYRFQQTKEGSREVLLSLEDIGFHDYQIQRIRISTDQKFLATGLKSPSSEESTCIVLNLKNLQVMHFIRNVFSFEWAADNVLFHTIQENLQCLQVYLTDFNNENSTKLVYTEEDPRFFVDLYCTRDKRFLTLNSNSKTTSEVWLVDMQQPFKSPFLVHQRVPGMIYHVEHRNDFLYILTTYGEPAEYKLMKTPISSKIGQWEVVYKVKDNTKLVDLEILKDYCIMLLKQHTLLYLEVVSLCNETISQSIKLPDWACAFELQHHLEYDTGSFIFYLTSPIQPPVLFAYSFLEHRLSIDAKQQITDTQVYKIKRLEAKSKDGTMVPITIFFKACKEELTMNPLLIHVYGAYGMDLNMTFKAEKRMLIEDGWILAYCHVRGGGELGCKWHRDGILDKKRNGLEDLQTCVVHLHELGYSQPCYTSIEASSAGGVLAGALCNSKPYLFKAMVLEAPFLDVLNTMTKSSLPLTTEEWEEWGNPLSDSKYYKYIQSYCPYENIKSQNYPSVLITAYKNDQRIPLDGLLRFMTKLRKAVADYYQSSHLPESRIPNLYLDIQPGGSHCDSLSWEESVKKKNITFQLGLD
ncbi:prolyl endopeptidase-like isoform X2 [Bombina bombina]|uniref:prolyl endopeptidase-like isoform X2 n=1 Tax=Bombina bombina TaxID=8345 RepID=UPI00235B1BB4|nr:prolyl endopeptidase-like isoform X2 [Bombina bombina]